MLGKRAGKLLTNEQIAKLLLIGFTSSRKAVSNICGERQDARIQPIKCKLNNENQGVT